MQRSVCSTCGKDLEALRAGSVRLISDEFRYFCDLECAGRFKEDDTAESHPRLAALPPPDESTAEGRRASTPPERGPEVEQPPDSKAQTEEDTAEGTSPPERVPAPQIAPSQPGPERLLVVCGISAGLSVVLLLAVSSPELAYARLGLLAIAAGALVAAEWPRLRSWRDSLPLAPPALALLLAGWASLGTGTHGNLTLAAWMIILAGVASRIFRRFESGTERELQRLRRALGVDIRRVDRGSGSFPQARLKPGEEILLHAGDLCPVDATVSAGRGELVPWLDGDVTRELEGGDNIIAGSRLRSGQVRAVVRWTGNDRQWVRLTLDETRRADTDSAFAKLGHTLAIKGGALAGVLAGGLSLIYGASWDESAGAAVGLLGAFLHRPLLELPGQISLRTILRTLRRGIIFQSTSALELAGRVSTVTFCARGSLLLGEPELSSIESFGGQSAGQVLAWAAGAFQAEEQPMATTLLRAARSRDVRPDAVRTPNYEAGLGIQAVTSDGQSLAIGSRALMLRERISVARAERRITELEATGRSAVLVAVGGHLKGILALQDGLRPGAKAAVQHLLDVGLEPVLISGDTRETCEAIGRDLDIQHVRPEILPADRGREVERLRSGGAIVATVGESPSDDVALAAGSLSIALPGPGFRTAEFDVELADGAVQTATLSLRLAREGRLVGQRVLGSLIGGSLGGGVVVIALNAPPWLAAAAALVSSLVAGALVSGPELALDNQPSSDSARDAAH